MEKLEKIYWYCTYLCNYIDRIERSILEQNEEKFYSHFCQLLNYLYTISSEMCNDRINMNSERFLSILQDIIYYQQNCTSIRDFEQSITCDLKEYVRDVLAQVLHIISPESIYHYRCEENKEFLEKNKFDFDQHAVLLDILNNGGLNKYTPEFSKSGDIVLATLVQGKKHYLYSSIDPYKEAFYFADSVAKRNVERYIICGCALPLWVMVLVNIHNKKNIDIYCSDKEMIFFDLHYRWYEHFFRNGVRLFYDEDYSLFAKAAKEYPDGVIIDTNVFDLCKEPQLRRKLQRIYISDMSFRNSETKLKASFETNTVLCKTMSKEFLKQFEDKEIFIFAAGPSLNKNINKFKNLNRECLLISTGTAFKRLINEGIIPDYVIILDCKDTIWNQFENVKNDTIPVIMASTACSRVAKEYQGEKYIICQKGYGLAEKFADDHNIPTYSTGGSVSTIAMSFAIQSAAKRVVFVGLDLAFTNNTGHAEGTGSALTSKESDMFPVKSWDQTDTVLSDNKFDIYRTWFVEQIRELRKKGCKTEIINATEGGSYIEGMENITLEEALKR